MKTSLFLSTLSSLIFLIGTAASADVSVIATPVAGGSPAELERVISHPLVLSRDRVFSTQEAQAVAELGAPLLALTTRLQLADDRAFLELKSWAASRGLKVDLSPASLPVRLEDAPASPNEPLISEQWGLINDGHTQLTTVDDITSVELPGRAGEDVGLNRAAPEKPSDKPIIVAVLDTGIDFNHPELKSRIVNKPQECAALDSYKACLKAEPKATCDRRWANFDSDGNGYPLDCSGWNVTVGKNPLTGIQGNGNAADDAGHGTHVAGIIAAARNALGVRGVSTNALILPVKVITAAPKGPVRPQSTEPLPNPSENGVKWDTGFADIIARGLLYAIRSGAQVVNLSLAWPLAADSELMRGMVRLARARGVLIVAAAGNDATEAPVLPCNYDGVICVAAHAPDGSLTRFSNHGSGVDIAAPGINILSTWPMALRPTRFTDFLGYEFKNGTSMASPFVAGVLARILSEGISPEEAFARLLTGSRPRVTGAQKTSVKYTRFGNADIAGSLSALPQPLILPESKDAIKLSWDRKSDRLALPLALKNLWKSSGQTRITLSLGARAAQFARLETSEWTFSDWAEQERRELPTALLIANPEVSRIPGDLTMELRIESDGSPARTYRVRAQITVTVTPGLQDKDIASLSIRGGSVSDKATLRSVIYAGPHTATPPHDYLAVEKGPQSWKFQLLSRDQSDRGEEIGDYIIRSSQTLTPPNGDLLSLYRVDWNLDGSDEYVFVFTIPHPQGKKNAAFQFQFLDSSLNLIRKIDYLADQAMLPEGFQWLALKDRLTPAWVTSGFTPPLEKSTKFDPWNPNPSDTPSLKFYYLADDGLRTVKAPDGKLFVTALAMDSATQASRFGSVRVLLAKGSSYDLAYSTAQVGLTEKGLALSPDQSLSLPKYRMLVGVDSLIPTFSLEAGGLISGMAFGSSGSKNSLRTTLLLAGDRVMDQTQRPISSADTVLRLAGAFSGVSRASVFVQTQYDLQYHDLGLKQAASTSLRRFSFIPQLAFLRSFLPVVVSDSSTGERLPGMLVLGDLSGSETSEVMLPIYDSNANLTGLESPARLKLEAGTGCRRVGNPVDADALSPSRILYFCGDRILSIAQSW